MQGDLLISSLSDSKMSKKGINYLAISRFNQINNGDMIIFISIKIYLNVTP